MDTKNPFPPPAEIITAADEAKKLVYGDRNAQYGPPTKDLARTAKMWSAILDTEVTAKQVALCMVALKISRECFKPKADNIVDGIGYFLCAERVDKNI